jgi:small subunit ribosomal protein S17
MNQEKEREKRPHRMRGHVERAGVSQATIAVVVDRFTWNKRLRKQIRRSKRYLVHDPNNTAGIGDMVEIEQCRPISKRKHYRIIHVKKSIKEEQ